MLLTLVAVLWPLWHGSRRFFLSLLATLGIPYDSEQAVRLAGRIAGHIQRAAHAASAELARQRGAFPAFGRSRLADAAPMRNAQVTSVAPTGTISLIAGTTAGIEPMFAIAYTRAILGRQLLEVKRAIQDSDVGALTGIIQRLLRTTDADKYAEILKGIARN